jgi:flagellar hook-length control protein FliK
MPTSAAAVPINALNAANLRMPAVAPVEQKDAFQALLDIGVEDVDTNTDRNQRPIRDDNNDRKEILAAPVTADVNAPDRPAPPVHEDGDHDAHVRAYRNDNEDRRRLADKRSDEDTTAVKRPEAKDTREVEGKGETRRAEKNATPTRPVAPEDNTDRDQLGSDLRARLTFLNQVLQLFVSLGGNPQAAQEKADSVLLQVSSLAVVNISAKKIDVSAAPESISPFAAPESISPFAAPEVIDAIAVTPQNDKPLDVVVDDILAKLTQLTAVLNQPAPTSDPVRETAPDFRALVRDMQQLALQLNSDPDAVKIATTDDKTQLIYATRTLMRQYALRLESAPKIAAQEPTDIVAPTKTDTVDTTARILPRQAMPEATLQIANAVRTEPVVSTTPLATLSAATATALPTNTDTRSGTGEQNSRDQAMPQMIGALRPVGAAQASQAAAPDFARLLQQARTPVLDQVMVNIKTGLAENKSEIKISLQPEDLGKLEIKIHVDTNGKTVASIMADNKNTLDLLQRDARGLERALSDAGLKADSGSLSFNLRGGQQENNQNPLFAQPYKTPLSDEADPLSAPVVSRNYVMNITDGLDLTV